MMPLIAVHGDDHHTIAGLMTVDIASHGHINDILRMETLVSASLPATLNPHAA